MILNCPVRHMMVMPGVSEKWVCSDMMHKKDKIILVTGATGNQGSAVTNSLVSHGWSVRALVRDVSKPSVGILRSKGVDTVKGNLDDRETLDSALQSVYGVFAVHTWKDKD